MATRFPGEFVPTMKTQTEVYVSSETVALKGQTGALKRC